MSASRNPYAWDKDEPERAAVLPLDWDFDGDTDIALQCGWGATGNLMYDLWILRDGRWRYIPEFRDDVTSPRRHPERRVVRGYSHGGMVGLIHQKTEHAWVRGEFVLQWEMDQVWSHERQLFHRVVRRRRGGGMAVESDRWLSIEEVESEPREPEDVE